MEIKIMCVFGRAIGLAGCGTSSRWKSSKDVRALWRYILPRRNLCLAFRIRGLSWSMPVLREEGDRCTPTLYIKGHGRSETGRPNGRRTRKAERWPPYRRLDGLRILMSYCIEHVCK